ncbi:MAG: nuclease [Verrucomicrobia bacterium]|nr:nuclease [Verrucomicrobiota bacterium]
MKVIIDDREVQAGVLEHLRAMTDVAAEVRRLHLGDYLVDDRVLFERKTVSDFAISLVDGRLFQQGCRLANGSFRPVLILEGAASDFTANGVRREAVQGALITLTILLGIPLLRAVNPAETARLIRYTGDQLDRQADGVVARPGYRPKGKRKRQLYILQGLPGVGPKRAQVLLDAFGSVQAAMTADADALARAGFGPKVADTIRQAVSESCALYGGESSSAWLEY